MTPPSWKLNAAIPLLIAACFAVSALAEIATPVHFVRKKPLPNGVVGHQYEAMVPIMGGSPPYHCKVLHGQLPPGLTMETKNEGNQASYCLIHGVPTKSGKWDGLTILEKAE
jgi:hypothetical protein